MFKKKDSSQESVMIDEARLIEAEENQPEAEEEYVPAKYVEEFITRHHLDMLWEEFVYEKNHPKIPLSATEVLAMINLSPEEQEKILKDHE
ncbi:MAG: hypothetical protein NPMRD1_60039 [Nitrosopumilales archaeon]|nr:MAG: hypothetical protein NPMRD1_60039 [Nitrosopumilales archaeon]